GLREAIGARPDLEYLTIVSGLLVRPYAFLGNPAVRLVSGFFGPVERAARQGGARVQYLPLDFHGLERLGLRAKPRVVLAVTSPPDCDGWLSFGLSAAASYRPFLEAARDPERLALAEVNAHMPRVDGLPEFGRNRVHLSEVDGWVEHAEELVALPAEQPSPEDAAIARQVAELVDDGSTLQFGSVNGALAIDLSGQVAADHVGGRQYSGVGGHEAFVMGASEAPGGRSIVCLKSTATVRGERISTIVPALPAGTLVTTPRHHVQWVVTEHGAVDLSALGDVDRARALVEVAHPDFREGLRNR